MGVTCRRCNCKEHYWLETSRLTNASVAKRQMLRSGTVIAFQLPYRYWFVAMHLLTATKGLFRRRDTATAGAQALPAHMGNGQ